MYLRRIINTSLREETLKLKKIRKFAETNIFDYCIYSFLVWRKDFLPSKYPSLLLPFFLSVSFSFHFVFHSVAHFLLLWFPMPLYPIRRKAVYREINDEHRTYLLDYQVLLFLHTLRNNGCDGSTMGIGYVSWFPSPSVFASRNVLES